MCPATERTHDNAMRTQPRTTMTRYETIAEIAAMDPSKIDARVKSAAVVFDESESDILTSVLEYRSATAQITNYR